MTEQEFRGIQKSESRIQNFKKWFRVNSIETVIDIEKLVTVFY